MKLEKETLDYCIQSYSFVLPLNGTFTFAQWAKEIKKVYDQAQTRHSAIIKTIESLNGKVIRRNGTTALEFS